MCQLQYALKVQHLESGGIVHKDEKARPVAVLDILVLDFEINLHRNMAAASRQTADTEVTTRTCGGVHHETRIVRSVEM